MKESITDSCDGFLCDLSEALFNELSLDASHYEEADSAEPHHAASAVNEGGDTWEAEKDDGILAADKEISLSEDSLPAPSSTEYTLDVYLVGYPYKGESVLFFLKSDEKLIYSGLVDCYETKKTKRVHEILRKEDCSILNFICWTHAHDDHFRGMESIFKEYVNEKTIICLPEYRSETVAHFKPLLRKFHKKILARNARKKPYIIKYASCHKLIYRMQLPMSVLDEKYYFRIETFAPIDDISEYAAQREKSFNANIWSAGVLLSLNHHVCLLAGDIENETSLQLPDNWDCDDKWRIRYVKMPHHASPGAKEFHALSHPHPGMEAIAASTSYKPSSLPNAEVLSLYEGMGYDVYTTTPVSADSKLPFNYGVVQTTLCLDSSGNVKVKGDVSGNAARYISPDGCLTSTLPTVDLAHQRNVDIDEFEPTRQLF